MRARKPLYPAIAARPKLNFDEERMPWPDEYFGVKTTHSKSSLVPLNKDGVARCGIVHPNTFNRDNNV
jgi:hypothetical protein